VHTESTANQAGASACFPAGAVLMLNLLHHAAQYMVTVVVIMATIEVSDESHCLKEGELACG